MRCRSCGRPLLLSGFPGACVSCPCGVDSAVPYPRGDSRAVAACPYRAPATSADRLARRAATIRTRAEDTPFGLCPRCTDPFAGTSSDDRRECIWCGGEFLSHTPLKSLIDDARMEHGRAVRKGAQPLGGRANARLEQKPPYLPCPACRELMSRMNFGGRSGVVVDVCRTRRLVRQRRVDEGAHDCPPTRAEGRAGTRAVRGISETGLERGGAGQRPHARPGHRRKDAGAALYGQGSRRRERPRRPTLRRVSLARHTCSAGNSRTTLSPFSDLNRRPALYESAALPLS
jgi:hypothetical protein